jgi:hypothetical protein
LQDDVDQAALETVLENDAECGDWYLEGRLARDIVISFYYCLTELPGDRLHRSNITNVVVASDDSTIIYSGTLNGGTKRTLLLWLNQKQPYLMIDATELSPEHTIWRTREALTYALRSE